MQVQFGTIKSLTPHLAQKVFLLSLWDWGFVFSFLADISASICWSFHRPATRLDCWPRQSERSGGCSESNSKSEGCFSYFILPLLPHICNVNWKVWEVSQALWVMRTFPLSLTLESENSQAIWHGLGTAWLFFCEVETELVSTWVWFYKPCDRAPGSQTQK